MAGDPTDPIRDLTNWTYGPQHLFDVTANGVTCRQNDITVNESTSTLRTVSSDIVRKQYVLTLDDLEVDIANGSNAGYGYELLLTKDNENFIVEHAFIDLSLTAGSGGIADDAEGTLQLGYDDQADVATAAADEYYWFAATDFTLVAGVDTLKEYDATASSSKSALTKPIYLNIIVDTADISAVDTMTVSGTITLDVIEFPDSAA